MGRSSSILSLSRRDLIGRFGLAGILAGALFDRRVALAQNAAPNRRFVFVYVPGGMFRHTWQPESWHTGAKATLSGAEDISMATFGQFFGRTHAGQRSTVLDVFDRPAYSALKSDVMVIDNVDFRANVLSDNIPGSRGDRHHHGITAALRGCNNDDMATGNASNGFKGVANGSSIDRYIGTLLYPGGIPAQVKNVCATVRLGDYGYQSGFSEVSEGMQAFEADFEIPFWNQYFQGFTLPSGVQAPSGPTAAQVRAWNRRALLHDFGAGEIASLKAALSTSERETLDKHLEALTEIKRQAKADWDLANGNANQPVITGVTVPAKPTTMNDGKSDILAKYKTFNKMVARAFAFERLRVCNYFAFGHNTSDGAKWIGGAGDFHGLSHGGWGQSNTPPSATLLLSGRTFLEAIADLMLELKSIPEGNGTVLDSTTIVTYVDMSMGDHESTGYQAPLFVFGGGGLDAQGRRHWKSGRYVKFPSSMGSMNDMWTSLARCAGEQSGTGAALRSIQRFGNPAACTADGGLSGLTTV